LLTLRRAALTIAAFVGCLTSARAETVWTAVASEKIRPEIAARSVRDMSLAAARNEFEAFQVVVTGPARGVSASASVLSGPGTIPAPKLFREALITLQSASAADGAAGRFPDALVPDTDDVVGEKRNAFPFDVPAGESRAIWVDYHVPPDAVAGTYHGTVTLHTAQGETAVPVRLTVWDFALPSTSSLKTSFTMTHWGVAKVHGVSGDALTAVRQRYAQLALDHRISISDLWDDGREGDWAHFDEAYGPFLEGQASTRLRGARLTSLRSGASLKSAAEHAGWAAHFRSRGWFDRLFQYTCDEPPITCSWRDIPARARIAKEADPDFRTLVTTDLDQAEENAVSSSIDLMVPVVNALDDRPPSAYGWAEEGEKAPAYGEFLRSGSRKELWLYQSCMSHGCGGTVDIGNPSADQLYFTGWPSTMIDASAVRSRALEWFSFRYGATGELYYETTMAYYNHDAWSSQWDFSGNGDGTLFYPGTVARIGGSTEIPVASLRLKMIREGMEDYEYLKLLSDLGGGAEAQEIARRLFPHAYQADASTADLMTAREALARAILSRGGHAVPVAGLAPPSPPLEASGVEAENLFDGGCASGGPPGASLLLLALLLLGLLTRRSRRAHRGV
jgi:MYXO-CTERM domain-containing protein